MVDSPYPFSLVLPQTDTEAILTARLEELGGHVERGVALEAFSQDEGGVWARLGSGETVAAPTWSAPTAATASSGPRWA